MRKLSGVLLSLLLLLQLAPIAAATPCYFMISSAVTGEGTVTPCEIRAVQNTSKKVEITPAEGWETAFVLVNGVNVGSVSEYSFEHIQSDIAVEVVFMQKDATWDNPYSDVTVLDWYYESVRFVSRENLMGGSGEKFEPEAAATRAMAAVVFWRMSGSPVPTRDVSPDFEDISSEQYYSAAVSWAVENGLMSGYGDGLFGPEDAVTREQFITMLWRYAVTFGYGSEKADISALTDADKIPEWAKGAAGWALRYGIAGTGGTLDGAAPAERAQVAVMLRRFKENVPAPVKPEETPNPENTNPETPENTPNPQFAGKPLTPASEPVPTPSIEIPDIRIIPAARLDRLQ